MFYQYKKVEKINNDINDKIILWKYVLVNFNGAKTIYCIFAIIEQLSNSKNKKVLF